MLKKHVPVGRSATKDVANLAAMTQIVEPTEFVKMMHVSMDVAITKAALRERRVTQAENSVLIVYKAKPVPQEKSVATTAVMDVSPTKNVALESSASRVSVSQEIVANMKIAKTAKSVPTTNAGSVPMTKPVVPGGSVKVQSVKPVAATTKVASQDNFVTLKASHAKAA